MNAYNYIRQEETNTDGLAFITKVYSSIEDDSQDVTVEKVHEIFMAKYGESKTKEVFEDESEYDIGRVLAKDFLDRSGLATDNLPQVIWREI